MGDVGTVPRCGARDSNRLTTTTKTGTPPVSTCEPSVFVNGVRTGGEWSPLIQFPVGRRGSCRHKGKAHNVSI